MSSDPASLNGLKVAIVHSSSERCAQLKSLLEQWGAMALSWTDLDAIEDYAHKHAWRPHMLIMEHTLYHSLADGNEDEESTSNVGEEALSTKYQTIGSLEVPTVVLASSAYDLDEEVIEKLLQKPGTHSDSRFHWFKDPLSPGVLRSFIQRVVIKPAN